MCVCVCVIFFLLRKLSTISVSVRQLQANDITGTALLHSLRGSFWREACTVLEGFKAREKAFRGKRLTAGATVSATKGHE